MGGTFRHGQDAGARSKVWMDEDDDAYLCLLNYIMIESISGPARTKVSVRQIQEWTLNGGTWPLFPQRNLEVA